jgi:hypothetical protein
VDQAPLRQWDGAQWTAATAAPPGDDMQRAPARGAALDVVEIAVVTVNSAGQPTEEFETLVQPQRDVGATVPRNRRRNAQGCNHFRRRRPAHRIPRRWRHCGRAQRGLRHAHGRQRIQRAGIDIDWGRWSGHPRPTRCKLEQACGELAYLSTASTGHSSTPERPPSDARAGPFVRADLPAGGCSATDGHADSGVPA